MGGYNTFDNVVAVFHDPADPTTCVCPGSSTQFIIGGSSDEGCNGIGDTGPGIRFFNVLPGECYTILMTNWGESVASAGRGPMLFDVGCVQAECFPSEPPTVPTLADGNGIVRANYMSRMIPVQVTNPGRQSAIRVEFVDLPPPYDIWNGKKLWASAPVEICEIGGISLAEDCPGGTSTYLSSQLTCGTPHFMDWNAVGVVHLWHEGILPSPKDGPPAIYNIQVIDEECNVGVELNFSEVLVAETAIYGDIVSDCSTNPCGPVDNIVNIVDPLSSILAFTGAPGKPSKARADMVGRCLDAKANITDTLDSVNGFNGIPYAQKPSDVDPCEVPCLQFVP